MERNLAYTKGKHYTLYASSYFHNECFSDDTIMRALHIADMKIFAYWTLCFPST